MILSQQQTFAAGPDDGGEAIEEARRNRFAASGDDGDRPRDADPVPARGSAGDVGQSARERAEERLIYRRHLARDAVERRSIERERDGVARRYDRGGARRAGKEPGLPDRLANADLIDRALLSLDPHFEPAGHHDIDGVGRGVLSNQNFAAQEVEHLGL